VSRLDVLRRLLVPATLAGVGFVLWTQREAIGSFRWRVSWPSLVLAALLFSLPPLLGASAFWVLLRRLSDAPFGPSIRLWMRAFVARFVPGGLVALAVRLDGCRRVGASPRQMVSATAYELLAAAFGGAAAAVLAFGLRGERPPALALAVVAVLVSAAVATPRLSTLRLVRRLERVPRRTLACAGVISAAGWLPAGAAAWTLTAGLAPSRADVRFVAGAYALAWLVGFVVVFAPSGLGVREATLVALLAPRFGLGPATVLALMLRFANVLGDLTAAGATEAIAVVRARRTRAGSGGDGLARSGGRGDASVHRFDRVAVGVDDARRVVLPAVLGADAREPFGAAAGLDRGGVERLDRVRIRGG
jgi:glycosyltransferase 2 family protein